jgi:ribosomal 50S subunit-recycling heat shock protein
MRLDLFLKQTGLIKRRPIAKAMCDGGKVARNGNVAKSGDEVRAGDHLRIDYGLRTVDVEVLSVPTGAVGKTRRDEFFCITAEQRHEESW